MISISIAVLLALACWKLGAYKRWQEFYPTILYVIIGDLAYNFLFYNYSLWLYKGFINHTFSDMLYAFFVFPSVLILFLTHWPATRLKQAGYVLLWSAGLFLGETVCHLSGGFLYKNGWNAFYSFGVYFIGLLLAKLHTRHPLVVWPVSGLLALLTALLFELPLEVIK
ncbi:MAG: CBO0543 family protein [Christensenellales bacterium]